MNLVNEKNRARDLLKRSDHPFESLFELTAVFRARQHSSHVQRIHSCRAQHLWNFTQMNLECETFSNSCFANPWLADVNRIVLTTPAQYLNRPLQLVVAADERIDLSLRCALDQVNCKSFQRISGRPCIFLAFISVDVWFITCGRNSVRDVVEYGKTCNSMLVQKKHSMRMLCVE